MSSLDGTRVVVAGGAGGVGEGIVRSLLRQGARVVVLSRNEGKLRELKSTCGDIDTGELIPLAGDLGEEAGARDLQNRIYEKFRELDVAVVSLGGWSQGNPLTSVDMDTWNRVLRDNLTSHFLALKILVPLLHPKTGSFVHVNSFSAEQPFPMAGPVAMASAAQKSMILTLAEELRPTGIRVYELILGPIKTRQLLLQGAGQDDWYTPEDIGDYLVGLAASNDRDVVHRLVRKLPPA